ncbi:MAG: rhomboid family intramembrane serine protease [Gammaproteobacteria bacterium]|nr:rhomboid family intramembrane serine protease [Gammaproteobacteria bacterium]
MGSVAARAVVLLASTGLIWAVSLYGILLDPGMLYDLALLPRRADGLPGVIGMPFVHRSWAHLLANSGPLLVLGALVLFRGVRYYLAVTATIVLVGGIGVWLLGRDAAHIGSSGLVFGFAAFLVVRGLYERRPGSTVIALLVFIFYGSLIWGVVPQGDGTSWEAHLFGLLAGMVAARAAVALERPTGQDP